MIQQTVSVSPVKYCDKLVNFFYVPYVRVTCPALGAVTYNKMFGQYGRK